MDKAALVRAAFRGLAEGIFGDEESHAAPGRSSRPRARKPTTRRRAQQLPLSPEIASGLEQQFEAVDPRGPDDRPAPTLADLDAMFRGTDTTNEAAAALRRQMEQARVSADLSPKPQKPDDAPMVWGGIPDV